MGDSEFVNHLLIQKINNQIILQVLFSITKNYKNFEIRTTSEENLGLVFNQNLLQRNTLTPNIFESGPIYFGIVN